MGMKETGYIHLTLFESTTLAPVDLSQTHMNDSCHSLYIADETWPVWRQLITFLFSHMFCSCTHSYSAARDAQNYIMPFK